MNIAIIIAGGKGTRMGNDIPKQFIPVMDKPVLVYTLESFQKSDLIDCIEVVCIDGWENEVKSYINKYNISKLKWIVPGGKTGQESIRNGIYYLEKKCDENDNIVIHDGIRPLVDDDVLVDLIDKCNMYGNAVTSMPYNEQIFIMDDEKSTTKYIPRDTLRRVATPQAYKYKLLIEKYREAFDSSNSINIGNSSYANTLMVDLGVRLYFSKGSDRNIKLTTPGDLEIFEAMLNGKNIK